MCHASRRPVVSRSTSRSPPPHIRRKAPSGGAFSARAERRPGSAERGTKTRKATRGRRPSPSPDWIKMEVRSRQKAASPLHSPPSGIAPCSPLPLSARHGASHRHFTSVARWLWFGILMNWWLSVFSPWIPRCIARAYGGCRLARAKPCCINSVYELAGPPGWGRGVC